MKLLHRSLTFALLYLTTAMHAAASDDHLQHRDIAYGSHKRQVLDIYAGKQIVDAPIILMVHGGAWRYGDKAGKRVVDTKVARWVPKGFLFISTNYRLVPDVDPRQQADDIAAAVKFVRDNAKQWGGDPQRLILMGHSAGAHLINLISAAPKQFGFVGNEWLGAVSLDTGGLDLERIMTGRHPRLYDQAFGDDPVLWQRASPLRQLTEGGPPVLLVCSTQRGDNPCVGSATFADVAHKLGRRVEVLPQDMTHGEINYKLGDDPAYTTAVERFLASLDADIAQRLSIH